MNIIVENILKSMCEFGGRDYNDFDSLNDDKHIRTRYKYPDSEAKFKEWFINYVYKLKISELRILTSYPYIYYRKKKECVKLVDTFIFNYGFMSYERNIVEERKDKINKLIK